MAAKFCMAVFLVICFAYADAAVNCTAAGRFADPSDETCKNYTLCVLSGTGYIGYDYVCPTTSLFNPNTRLCTANYICNVTNSNNTTNTTSVCTSEGFTADPDSPDCSSYVLCLNQNGTFEVGETLTCPNGTYYNPNTTLCEADYNCTSSTPFSCSAAGRFSDPADNTCKLYYLCVLALDGTYLQYQYTCPSISLFNPNSRVCTTSYTCPS